MIGYIQYIDSDPLFEDLYDLDADDQEAVNLAIDPDQADRIQAFRQQLVQMRASVK